MACNLSTKDVHVSSAKNACAEVSSCEFLLTMLSCLVTQPVLEHDNADEWKSVWAVVFLEYSATRKC